jgi:hypothetical protein
VTECTQAQLEFPSLQRRKIQADFSGGEITSNGGALLLRQIDRRIGLTPAIASVLADERQAARCQHSLLSMVRQRVYALALGEEDLNDHQELRHDLALQTAVERDTPLASASTLCRFENRADRVAAWAMHEVLIEQFIASFDEPPRRLILDVDATDDAVHGQQDGRFFHGYYDHYCFLPLYVFCGEQLLVSYLRPSKIDGAKHAWGILALLIKRLRQTWPKVEIIVRGDSGFCRWRMLSWFERHDVGYIIGIARNGRLNRLASPLITQAEQQHQDSGAKQRLFTDIPYAAKTWDHPRRVIVKAEHSERGSNPRYVVTNLKQSSRWLYDRLYCARGDMENRIKEQQMDLFADRTSCHAWWPNQFRLLLSSLAYTLLERLRAISLQATEYAKAQAGTIRLKLLKVGAIVIRNTRRIRFLLSSAYPHQALFCHVAARLDTS